MRAATVRRLLRRIDQHHLDPRLRRDIGDAGAHHAAPMTPSFFTMVGHVGPVRALFQRFLVMKRLRIMAVEDGFIRTEVKCRASIRSAASKGTKRTFVDRRQQGLGGGIGRLASCC